MQSILIVDDERDIREIISFNLSKAGYQCLSANNGRQALTLLEQQGVDLLLLDVMMPEMSGFDVARAIRNDEITGIPYDLPIIFLTALGEEADKLHGFSIGADDYIAKPFSVRELQARVAAVLKRRPLTVTAGQSPEPHIPTTAHEEDTMDICYESLHLYQGTFTACIDEEDIGLTKMEYELLHFLLQHPRAVYSRSELLSQVWPNNGLVLDRTVDVTITRLRKKLGIYKDNLKTKTGYGYYWTK